MYCCVLLLPMQAAQSLLDCLAVYCCVLLCTAVALQAAQSLLHCLAVYQQQRARSDRQQVTALLEAHNKAWAGRQVGTTGRGQIGMLARR